jgi:aminoglycoside 6'-N-acetyltransferase
MSDPTYAFPPLTRRELPIIRQWLEQPHVRTWWGDPEEQFAHIANDLSNADMSLHLVALDQEPFAFVQRWTPGNWGEYLDQPAGTVGIDAFIGKPEMLNAGHGSRMIAAFTAHLFAQGAPRIIIDPDPDNTRAIRAYTKAGFRDCVLTIASDGTVLLMATDAPDLASEF